MTESVIGTLVYKITGDTKALDKGLDVSRQKISKTGESLVELGKKATKVGTVIFSGIFIKSCLEAASNVEELGNKFDTVFKGMESSADAWARKYADDTNRGVTATKEFLATQQDLRTGYGDSAESAARFSQAVVGVTNDLASFSNVPVADTMAAMQSGLSGQFEALRRLGVGLNTNIINQGEYAKSIGKTWEQMNNLERQEAILSGIMSQSKNAIHQNVQVWTDYNYQLGDAALTSDSFANSVQGAQQRLEDMKAELGESLLPIATQLLGFAVDAIEEFNSWDDSTQKLTVSLLAFGAAMVAVGGPVGAVLGALGGLFVLISGGKSETDKLTESTKNLKAAFNDYENAAKTLTENTENMSKAEKALYEIQLKRARLDIEKEMSNVASSYRKVVDNISMLGKAETEAHGHVLAYNDILDGLKKGNLNLVNATVSSLEQLEKQGKLSEINAAKLKTYRDELKNANNALKKGGDVLADFIENGEERYLDLYDEYIIAQKDSAEATLGLEESIMQLAIAVANGTIKIDIYKDLYPDLYAKIMEVAAGLEISTDAVEGNSDALQAAINVGRQWQDQRRAQIADLLEEQGEYQKAADIRKQILEDEKAAELQALAVSSGIIGKEETLTEERLQELLDSNEEFRAEYDAMNAYYASEAESVQNDAEKAIREALEKEEQDLRDHNSLMADLNAQAREDRLEAAGVEVEITNASRESTAAELDNAGRFREASNIRLQALKAEYDFNEKRRKAQLRSDIEELASKMDLIKADEDITQLENELLLERISATDEGLAVMSAMSERYRQKSILAERQYNDERARITADADSRQKAADDVRNANADVWISKLRDQAVAAEQARAAELEASGDIAGAYEIRLGLLDQEEQRELEALQAKIDANEATEQDKTNLQAYYAVERQRLTQQEADAEAAIVEKNLQEQENRWKSFLSELKSLVSDFGSAYVNLYSVMTDNAIAEIDRQTQAKLEALGIAEKTELERLQAEYDEAVKTGDMQLAKEKQDAIRRQQIEEEADRDKAELQRKQAERERSLRIFTTTLDMLSAIVKYLADPGGWAGVGLSAMAATTGALQIAAIKSEALPSFAVGANYIPEDMLAMVHQGETILPAPMAESVRRGDAVFGQVQVNVNIENYSSENVSVSEAEDGQTLTIMIGKAVEEGISTGRYDSALGNRFGIRKVGRNVR